MGAVTTSLGEQARSIFDDLGYTVSRTGTEFRAEYKWRVVTISVHEDDTRIPESGDLRCFVTRAHKVSQLYRRLDGMEVEYDWAVIGIGDDGDYEVVRSDEQPTV